MTFDSESKKNGVNRITSDFINTCKGPLWLSENKTVFRQELILFSALLLVLLTETLNTAIEAVVDLIGLEFQNLSGLTKDLGSAAVFISLVIAILVWSGFLCF